MAISSSEKTIASRPGSVRVITITAVVIVLLLVYFIHARTGRNASINVDIGQTGYSISPTFLGFSHDWTEAKDMMGMPSTGTNLIYRQLLGNLYQNGGGPAVIRIGGNSTDLTEFNGEPKPEEMSAYTQFSKDANAQFYLSVNLGTGGLELPVRQARSFIAHMPVGSLKAIEIGNEPDLYDSNGLRPAPYGFEQYLREFAARRAALQPLLPAGLKLMGPSWTTTDALRNLPEFLKSESNDLAGVSHHWYAGIACNGKKNPPNFLLNPVAATSGAAEVASSVAMVHAQGLFFRMGEMNSIACNGEPGVTDTFASALWMIDTLFEFANVGVDGVNVHVDTDDVYGPFLFNVDASRAPYKYSVNVIRPEYYGLYFFQQAAPGGSKLLRAGVNGPSHMKSWATIDGQGTVRVTIINKDEKESGKVTVGINDYGPGSLERLLAPNYHAKSGIAFGGLSFDRSQDGKPLGKAQSDTVVPHDGVYDIQIPATSAALLILKRP